MKFVTKSYDDQSIFVRKFINSNFQIIMFIKFWNDFLDLTKF